MENKVVRKAVIPAAGYGTRFLPATKAIAQEMFPIIDTPTIELIVREAMESGITEFLIIVSSNKNSIVNYFDRNLELEHILKAKGRIDEYNLITDLPNKVNIHFVRQKEQLGLGHAVLQARAFVGEEPFALLLGDDVYVGNNEPVLKQLINKYNKTQKSILGTLEVNKEDVNKFGICDFGNNETIDRMTLLTGVTEKPNIDEAKSNLAIGGRYILNPVIFNYLKDQVPGSSGEIQLTDSIKRMMETEEVYSYLIDGRRYDIGTRVGYIEAIIDFALKRDSLKEDVIKIMKDKISHL